MFKQIWIGSLASLAMMTAGLVAGSASAAECLLCSPGLETRASDGCSNPLKDGVTKRAKKEFRKSCDFHDMCYAMPGTTRKGCDDGFYKKMREACRKVSWTDEFYYICDSAALSFYTGVRVGAKKAFSDAQKWSKKHCQRKTAQKCDAGWTTIGFSFNKP